MLLDSLASDSENYKLQVRSSNHRVLTRVKAAKRGTGTCHVRAPQAWKFIRSKPFNHSKEGGGDPIHVGVIV